MAAAITTYRAATADATAAGLIAALERAGLAVEPTTRSTRAVLDTFDGRIAAAALRLELVDGHRLVLGGDGCVPATVEVAAQPAVAGDVPAGALRARVAELLGVRVLLRLLEVSSQRATATARNRAGKVTAAVDIHERAATTGIALDEPVVVEAIELAGYRRGGAELRAVIESAGFVPCAGLAELAATAAGVDLAGYAVPATIPLDPDSSALDGYRAVLANLRDALVANWDGVVSDVDPEFLHDLRVALRRTRVVLANAKRVIVEDVRAQARADFAWLGEVTGSVRDLDVYQLEWAGYVAPLDEATREALEPLRIRLAAQQADAHDRLSGVLKADRAGAVVDGWSAWLDSPVDPQELIARSEKALADVVARRTRRAHRVMVRRGRTIDGTTPAGVVHELRKDAKKLRYLVECFGALYDPDARSAFVARLKALQDILGGHQDAAVHGAQLRGFAVEGHDPFPPLTMIAIGRLVERLDQARRASRAELADRFAAFDRPKTRRALDDLLDGVRIDR